MELRHLRYFVTVAEEMHFSRAAERLNITPPTLTHQIKALETILGVRLFTRKGNTGVALTQIGTQFLEEARITVKQAARAELVARQAGRGEAGTIEVGFILAAACSGMVPLMINEFRKSHAQVSFQFHKMESFPQLIALTERTLDIGFVRAPERYPPGLDGIVVGRHRFWLAVPADHKLASEKIIDPEMLIDETFVSMSLEFEVGMGSNIGSILPPGKSAQKIIRATDVLSMLMMVASGIGLGVPVAPIIQIVVPGVVYREISTQGKPAVHAAVFRKSESSPPVKAFIAMLRKKHPKQ